MQDLPPSELSRTEHPEVLREPPFVIRRQTRELRVATADALRDLREARERLHLERVQSEDRRR